MFVERSIGLSGSTLSLCDLVASLDRRAYVPVVVFSRPEQQACFAQRVGGAINAVVIRPRDSLKRTATARRLLSHRWVVALGVRRLASWVLAIGDLLVGTLPYAFRLYRVARANAVDLCHQNNGFDVAAVLVARALGVPLVAYQRGEEWNSLLVRRMANCVDAYMANSESTKAHLMAIGVDPGRITVVYPPVDCERFDSRTRADTQRREFGVGEDELCFGILGQLIEWKGHPVFLKAAQAVLRAVPRARAFVVGEAPEGHEQYGDALRSMARALDIDDRVVFTGFRADIPSMIQLLDVVVHASIRPEPFGRVIVEAMAMKKPVIASKAGGPIEILVDGKTGFLVPPGDVDALTASIVQVLTDRSLAEEVGERAYRVARSRFSLPAHVRRVEDVYARWWSPPGPASGGMAAVTGVVPGRARRRAGWLRRLRLGAGTTLLVMLAVLPGGAVATARAADGRQASTEPIVIAGQLRQAVILGESAVRRLNLAGPDDRLDGIVGTIQDMYALQRLALAGLDNASRNRKLADPLLDYQRGRVRQAWSLTRSAVDRSVDGLSREEYLAIARRDLAAAISILKGVLLVLP